MFDVVIQMHVYFFFQTDLPFEFRQDCAREVRHLYNTRTLIFIHLAKYMTLAFRFSYRIY